MEIQHEVGEEAHAVPSLKLLAFNVVEQNLCRIGWRTDRIPNQMRDVISSEMSNLSLFERARLINLFKITDEYAIVAREIASYVDSHETPTERKNILEKLQALSTEMQRMIAQFRQN